MPLATRSRNSGRIEAESGGHWPPLFFGITKELSNLNLSTSQGSRLRKHERGVSMIEIVLVVMLIGILSGGILVKWQPTGAFTIRYQAEQFAQNIRHIQSLAMTWGLPLRLVISAGGYRVECVNSTGTDPCVNAGDVVTDPSENAPFSIVLEDGVTLSGFSTEFDEAGRPVSGAALLSADRVFTMTHSVSTETLTLKPVTGFVVN